MLTLTFDPTKMVKELNIPMVITRLQILHQHIRS